MPDLFVTRHYSTLPACCYVSVHRHDQRGQVELNGERLREGDGVRSRDERELTLSKGQDAEVRVFDPRPNEVPMRPGH